MTCYEISYKKNDVFQAILVNADSEEIARAWFAEYKPTAEIIGSGLHYGRKKPGMPEKTVPAEWQPTQEAAATVEAVEAQEQEQEQPAAPTNYQEIRAALAAALPVRQVVIDGYVWMLSADNRLMRAPLEAAQTDSMEDPWVFVWESPARAAVLARATVRGYRNQRTQEQTQTAAVALAWHRAGDAVTVSRYLDTYAAKYTTIRGARVEKPARDENRDYCKRVADELESYVAGDVRRCPNCGQEHARAWDDVGDKFRCPSCGSVDDVDDWEQLSIYDYMSDVLDYDFRIDSQREFSGIRVYVTLGGPSCWIDTERRTVEIRWGGESACYGLLSDTVDAVEEWGREIWECGQ